MSLNNGNLNKSNGIESYFFDVPGHHSKARLHRKRAFECQAPPRRAAVLAYIIPISTKPALPASSRARGKDEMLRCILRHSRRHSWAALKVGRRGAVHHEPVKLV